jgi:inhibitor of cysteine peptidase
MVDESIRLPLAEGGLSVKRRARTLALLVAVATLALLVAACNSAPPAPLELTEKDTGTTQTLSIGQELRISLAANPTTGYRWGLDGAVPSQLEQVGEPSYSAESTAIGAGGTEVWTFSAKSPGEGTLKLKYFRSFEPTAPPAQTFAVTTKVK